MTPLSLLALLAVLSLFKGLKLDREYQRGIIYRLGRVRKLKGPGLYWIIPWVDQKVQVDMRTRTVNIEPQETVTADSVTIRVNAVLYYRMIEPIRAINAVESYRDAVYQIALTTLRNVVGQNLLDDVLQSRDRINAKVQEIVDALIQGGPLSQAAAKDLIRAVDNKPINDAVVEDTAQRIAQLRATPEAQDGLSAFLDKRQPAWLD